MKKMVFFVLLLAFTRVGVALGMGTTPIGIGNFFLGSPSITESNLNQVLGLLVGPTGSPGVVGVSGANGKDGLNGLEGIPGINGVNGTDGASGINGQNGIQGVAGAAGRDGAPGPQGVAGPAGPAGPAGAPGTGGGGGFFEIGGGKVSLDACDDNVSVNFTQSFQLNKFDWASTVVSNIAGKIGTSNGCAGQYATLHVTALGNSFSCTIALDPELTGPNNTITFSITSCPTLRGVNMKDLDPNVGLEFTEKRVS